MISESARVVRRALLFLANPMIRCSVQGSKAHLELDFASKLLSSVFDESPSRGSCHLEGNRSPCNRSGSSRRRMYKKGPFGAFSVELACSGSRNRSLRCSGLPPPLARCGVGCWFWIFWTSESLEAFPVSLDGAAVWLAAILEHPAASGLRKR